MIAFCKALYFYSRKALPTSGCTFPLKGIPELKKNIVQIRSTAHKGTGCTERKKILLIMKLITAIMLTCSLHVSARVVSQSISYSGKNVKLEKVFSIIEQQTGYTIVANAGLIKSQPLISVEARKQVLQEFLKEILKPRLLEFTIENKTIFISQAAKKIQTKAETNELSASRVLVIAINGKVVDSVGVPLAGASVKIKGTNIGVTTNTNGEFTINARDADILVISFVGYRTVEAVVNSNVIMLIRLLPVEEKLDDFVVVAYGKQKKETLAGAISTLKGDAVGKSPQPNIGTALAGRMAGLTVINRSGSPGAENLTILIRGQATTGNNSPLIVIDGIATMQGSLERLNPIDIESISVLKDASAALYGAQAANGVILVTTKRGNTGKPVFDYSFNQGFVGLTIVPEMSSSAAYVEMLNEASYYSNPARGLFQRYSADDIQKFRNGDDPVNYPNTNWMDAVLKKYSRQSQHFLSVRGGGENVRYSVSAGYIKQGSIYKGGISDYNQYNLRSNLDIQVNERFKINFDVSGRQEDRVNPSGWPDAGRAGIFKVLYRTYPFVPVTWPNGTYSSGVGDSRNPVLMVSDAAGENARKFNAINGTLRANYNIPFVEGLSIDGFLSIDQNFNFVKSFAKSWTTYNYNKLTNVYTARPGGATAPNLTETHANQRDITANVKLNYNRHIGNHDIAAFASFEQNQSKYFYFNAARQNFIQTQLQELTFGGAAAADATNGSNSSETARQNYFTKLSYNYKTRYLAEFQLGYNGSTTFPRQNRFGVFPGILLGWRVSEEQWFKNDFITNLKLRGSYGKLGNDKVSLFQFYDNFSLNTTSFVAGQTNATIINYSKVANPAITWEVARKTDFGIEATLLKRINLELDYFRENRSNILGTRLNTLPQLSGISGSLIPSENLYETKNAGIEVQANYAKNFGVLRLSVGGNFTYAKNEIVFADEFSIIPAYQLQKGKPISAMSGSYLMYEAVGIFKDSADLASHPHYADQTIGDIKFKDINGDGVIDSRDRVRQTDTEIPRIQYGFNLGAEWKNIELTVLFQGAAKVRNYMPEDAGDGGNYTKNWSDNRWSPSNPNGTFPRADTRSDNSPSGGIRYRNTFWLFNSSYLRLKNVELGYRLPSIWTRKIGLSATRIYVSGFNLLTFTKLKDYDPEGLEVDVASTAFFPQNKVYNIGININF